MARKPNRTSPIWLEPREEFQERVNRCSSIAEILRSFHRLPAAANYKTVYARVKEDEIDISHIQIGTHSNLGRVFSKARRLATEYLYNGSTIGSSDLKQRIIRDKILEDKCVKCSIGPMWMGMPLSLQLHHINGTSNDNRLENLCILCPNCHAQTDTFVGRHLRGKKCIDCGTRISSKALRCKKCAAPHAIRAPRLPRLNLTKEELEKMVWEKSMSQLAKGLGVSNTTIKKYCRKLGVSCPPRGHWAKRQ
jgi:Zn finger protein HypA/HybF involved in hydrogenase expression